MSWTTEKAAIVNLFSGWNTSTVKWEGIPFSQPQTAWIAVSILDGNGFFVTLGTPTLRRHVGIVAIQIFDKENAGEAMIRTIADAVEALFVNINSQIVISATETISFGQPSLSAGQVIAGWRQRNISVPFYRDEQK